MRVHLSYVKDSSGVIVGHELLLTGADAHGQKVKAADGVTDITIEQMVALVGTTPSEKANRGYTNPCNHPGCAPGTTKWDHVTAAALAAKISEPALFTAAGSPATAPVVSVLNVP